MAELTSGDIIAIVFGIILVAILVLWAAYALTRTKQRTAEPRREDDFQEQGPNGYYVDDDPIVTNEMLDAAERKVWDDAEGKLSDDAAREVFGDAETEPAKTADVQDLLADATANYLKVERERALVQDAYYRFIRNNPEVQSRVNSEEVHMVLSD